MNENDMLKVVLSYISDVIVVEDAGGNVHYLNHPEIDYSTFTKPSKLDDEFYDEKNKRWYKLSEKNFNIDESRFVLKKYGHVTKMKKQQSLMEIDGKTGLLRNEIFKDRVEYLSQLGKEMIIVLIDIDNFKEVNDCYGHEAGDDVLSKIGILIKSVFRGSDLFGRFGGDELILSLVDINFDVAIQKLEIFREAVTNIVLANDKGSRNITISAGCTIYNNSLTYNDNIKNVDEILYVSKQKGRNKISSYKDIKTKNLKQQ